MPSSTRPVWLQRADGPTPDDVANAFRRGVFLDWAFDRYLPERLRAVSSNWWTPLEIAHEVAGWLDEHRIQSILDVGSGVGKFCVAIALASEIECIGLEHRPRLAGAARHLARLFEVENRVRFIQGAFGATELPAVDAFYLYNPFGENLFGEVIRLDDEVELNGERFVRDVGTLRTLLLRAPPGFHVIAYNGVGSTMPEGYELIRSVRRRTVRLELWRKVGDDATSAAARSEVRRA